MKGYSNAVQKFKMFSLEHEYDSGRPTEKVMIHYVAEMNEWKAGSVAFFK